LDKRPGAYQVLWSAGDQTWEPSSNLVNCQPLVAAFDKQLAAVDASNIRKHHQSDHPGSAQSRSTVKSTGQQKQQILALDSPPEALQEKVESWGLLTKWCVEYMICKNIISWATIQEDNTGVAEELAGGGIDDPTPLQRLADREWRWLPPIGQNYRLELRASVRMGEHQQLEWDMEWPETTTPQGGDGVPGYTRRIYEEYGSRNILQVHFPQGGEAGITAAKWLRAPNVVLRLGGRDWAKPIPRACSDNGHALIFFAVQKAAGDEVMSQRANEGVEFKWHLNHGSNLDMKLAKVLSRTSLMLSEVVPTVELSEAQIREDKLWADEEFAARADGNGPIAPDLLSNIYAGWLRGTGKPDDGRTRRPPPCQFRFGARAAKGTLSGEPALEAGTCCFTKKQMKYTMPRTTTKTQRLIEVCTFAHDSGPARLNMQVIVALESRMQRPMLLVDLLKKQLQRYTLALSNAHAADELCMMELGMEGEAIQEKLRAGFGYEHEAVQAALRHAMTNQKERWFDLGRKPKLHITLSESRRALMIPDRYRFLKENEVSGTLFTLILLFFKLLT
jgi:hypothetical protein